MQTNQTAGSGRRLRQMRDILTHERTIALERIRDLRRDQEQEAVSPPADEMDAARSLADIETHAGLIERAEERLKEIDFAFNRLEQGRYGICVQCGDDISVARIKVVPFAAYCLDCQEERNHKTRTGKAWLDEPFLHRWNLPEEMEETTETSHDEAVLSSPEETIISRVPRRTLQAKKLIQRPKTRVAKPRKPPRT